MKYKVIKQHLGDKQYFDGEEREVVNIKDADYLKEMGLIADMPEDKDVENEQPDADPKGGSADENEQSVPDVNKDVEAEAQEGKSEQEHQNKMAKTARNKAK